MHATDGRFCGTRCAIDLEAGLLLVKQLIGEN
jgi:hypothetical protein